MPLLSKPSFSSTGRTMLTIPRQRKPYLWAWTCLNMPNDIRQSVNLLLPPSSPGSFPGNGGVVMDFHCPSFRSIEWARDHASTPSTPYSLSSAASRKSSSSAFFTSLEVASPLCWMMSRLKFSFASSLRDDEQGRTWTRHEMMTIMGERGSRENFITLSDNNNRI